MKVNLSVAIGLFAIACLCVVVRDVSSVSPVTTGECATKNQTILIGCK